MRRLEYRVETFHHEHGGYNVTPSIPEVLERINALGADGWEVVPNAGAAGILLKRELVDQVAGEGES